MNKGTMPVLTDSPGSKKGREDGEVVALDELLSRRDFCRTMAAGAALVALQGCGGGGLSRVGTGGIDDNGGDPNGSGGGDAGGVPPDLASHGGRPPDMAMQQQEPPDLAMQQQQPPDLAMQKAPPDLTMPANQCPGGVFDTGKTPQTVQMNTAVYVQSQAAFLCHDANGFFAVSSICTHNGCTNKYVSANNNFHCPCHAANFSLNGAVQSGPTNIPLDHYILCLTGNGTIAIDTNTVVSPAKRYVL